MQRDQTGLPWAPNRGVTPRRVGFHPLTLQQILLPDSVPSECCAFPTSLQLLKPWLLTKRSQQSRVYNETPRRSTPRNQEPEARAFIGRGTHLHTSLCVRGLGATMAQTGLEATRDQQCWGRPRSQGTAGLQAPRVQNGKTNACAGWAKEACGACSGRIFVEAFHKIKGTADSD